MKDNFILRFNFIEQINLQLQCNFLQETLVVWRPEKSAWA